MDHAGAQIPCHRLGNRRAIASDHGHIDANGVQVGHRLPCGGRGRVLDTQHPGDRTITRDDEGRLPVLRHLLGLDLDSCGGHTSLGQPGACADGDRIRTVLGAQSMPR